MKASAAWSRPARKAAAPRTQILTVGGLNTSTTFAGLMTDGTADLGFTKVGAGTLTLGGQSFYPLATTVSAGTLQAAQSFSFSINSAFTVAAGAVLDLDDVTRGSARSPRTWAPA